MADPRSLRRSRRLQGERPEVGPEDPSSRFTPLRHVYTHSFDQESRDSDQTIKRRWTEPPSVEETSDSLEESQIEYLPSDFPFVIYQNPLSSPSPKR